MSVYYYKGARILAPLTILSNEPMFDVDTVSLKKQRASQNVQRWELSFGTVGEAETQVGIFLSSVTGIDEVNTMIMPQLPQVDALTTSSHTAHPIGVAASQDDSSITLQGAGTTGFMPKGTFFKFSNHGKIYVTTADADFDAGSPVVTFYPKLRAAVTTSHTLNRGSAALLSYYPDIDNMVGITFTDGVLSNAGTITVIEAL